MLFQGDGWTQHTFTLSYSECKSMFVTGPSLVFYSYRKYNYAKRKAWELTFEFRESTEKLCPSSKQP